MRFILINAFATVAIASGAVVRPHGCVELKAPNWPVGCNYGSDTCEFPAKGEPLQACEQKVLDQSSAFYVHWKDILTAKMREKDARGTSEWEGDDCAERFDTFRKGYDEMLVSNPPDRKNCDMIDMNTFFGEASQGAALALLYYYVPNAYKWIGSHLTVHAHEYEFAFLGLEYLPEGDYKTAFATFMLMHFMRVFIKSDFHWQPSDVVEHHNSISSLVYHYVWPSTWDPSPEGLESDVVVNMRSNRARLLYEFLYAMELDQSGSEIPASETVFVNGATLFDKRTMAIWDELLSDKVLEEKCSITYMLEQAGTLWKREATSGLDSGESVRSDRGLMRLVIHAGLISDALRSIGKEDQADAALDWVKTQIRSGGATVSAENIDYIVTLLPTSPHYGRQALMNVMRAISYRVQNEREPQILQLTMVKALILFHQLQYVAVAPDTPQSAVYTAAVTEIAIMFSNAKTVTKALRNPRNYGNKFNGIAAQVDKLLLASPEFSAN